MSLYIYVCKKKWYIWLTPKKPVKWEYSSGQDTQNRPFLGQNRAIWTTYMHIHDTKNPHFIGICAPFIHFFRQMPMKWGFSCFERSFGAKTESESGMSGRAIRPRPGKKSLMQRVKHRRMPHNPIFHRVFLPYPAVSRRFGLRFWVFPPVWHILR